MLVGIFIKRAYKTKFSYSVSLWISHLAEVKLD